MSAATEQIGNALQSVNEQAGSLQAQGGYQGAFSSQSNFEAAQRMAKALTSSSLVPAHFQGQNNLGNAVIALELSQRIGASPLMVMQNLYVVHGNPGWSAKFLIATFNRAGRFSAIKYEWKECDENSHEYGCRAYATEFSTGEKIYGPWITWKLVKAEGWDSKNGSKWKTMPEKMFMYRAAAWMIDANAPEISMGLPTEDQLHDVYDVDLQTGEITNTISARREKPEATRTSQLSEKLRQKADEIQDAEIVEPEETKGVVETVTEDQLESIINQADSVESLDDVIEMSEGLPSQAAKKRISEKVAIRKSEFEQE